MMFKHAVASKRGADWFSMFEANYWFFGVRQDGMIRLNVHTFVGRDASRRNATSSDLQVGVLANPQNPSTALRNRSQAAQIAKHGEVLMRSQESSAFHKRCWNG